jgi:hypothetical protein
MQRIPEHKVRERARFPLRTWFEALTHSAVTVITAKSTLLMYVELH